MRSLPLETEAARLTDLYPDLTVIHYELGDREKGMKYLKLSYQERKVPVLMIRYYPMWEKVIADPRVQALLAEPPSTPAPANTNNSVPRG